MRATAPTNVSPARRAPTWVAGKGQQQPSTAPGGHWLLLAV
jgi:hypothetical protein